jgi:ATP-binding cassette subfamily B protein
MRLKNYSFIHTEKNTKIIKQIQETLGSIRDVIIDNNHRYYASIYRKMQNKKRGTTAEIDFISTYPAYTLEALAFLIFAFLGIILTFTVDQTSSTLSLLGTLAIGSQKLLRSMQQIYGGISRIKGKSASFEVVLEIFKREIEPSQYVKEKEIFDFKSGIKLKNVFFQYNPNLPWTLRDINLNFNKGDIVGLIGETGTGKSTLIDIIMGLLDPTEGEILIDGKNIKKNMNLKKKWFNSISHVPQDIYLCDGTFAENIALGVSKEEINMDKVVKAAEIAQIKKDIELYSMKFDTFVGERGIKLSGGQKQRIAIARALYNKREVLIMDEATSALDNNTEKEIIDEIRKLKGKVTMVVIAHRLTTLQHCDEIYEISNGRISEKYNYEDISKSKK